MTNPPPSVEVLLKSSDVKKPRLFYWEESEDAWCPADGLEVANIVALELLDEGEKQTIEFKRVDMTDEEYDAIPEA